MDQQELIFLKTTKDFIFIEEITLPDISLKDSSEDPVNPAITYKSTIGDIEVEKIPTELKIHGRTLATWV